LPLITQADGLGVLPSSRTPWWLTVPAGSLPRPPAAVPWTRPSGRSRRRGGNATPARTLARLSAEDVAPPLAQRCAAIPTDLVFVLHQDAHDDQGPEEQTADDESPARRGQALDHLGTPVAAAVIAVHDPSAAVAVPPRLVVAVVVPAGATPAV